eukprot:5970250-Lingulodinium_polyedra.AAC.1
MHRPFCRLKKALHGHPDSGTFWEKKCDSHAESVGFDPIGAGVACVLLPRQFSLVPDHLRRCFQDVWACPLDGAGLEIVAVWAFH